MAYFLTSLHYTLYTFNYFLYLCKRLNWLRMRKILFLTLALILALPLTAAKAYTVVLDAGHGGKDPGAVGRFSQEKDLNLSLVLKVGALLNEQYPDVKVVYTRSTDVFIPLQTRADIANKNNADLFLSIHTNASESKDARGVETFILGYDRAEKNLDVAMRENAVMKLESDYKTTYHGFDPNSIESYIMFELMQNSYMDQSLQLATQVQKKVIGNLKRFDRGVQQASFWVLLKTACPSILFEMGFISNADEEKYLNSDSTMNVMAAALVNAFAVYTHRQEIKKVEPVGTTQPEPSVIGPSSVQDRSNVGPISEDNIVPAQEPQAQQTPQIYYALQVCASRTPLAADDPKLKGLVCECRQVGDWYKYYAIIDTDRSKVVEKQKEVKKLFPDCWITKFEK